MKKIQPRVNELLHEAITLLAIHNFELKERIALLLLEQERLKKDIFRLMRPVSRTGSPATSFIFNHENTVAVATIISEHSHSPDEIGEITFSEIGFRHELPEVIVKHSINAPFDAKLRDMLTALRQSTIAEEHVRTEQEETEMMLLRTMDLQNIEHFVLHTEKTLQLVSTREERMHNEITYCTIENISAASTALPPSDSANLVHLNFNAEFGSPMQD